MAAVQLLVVNVPDSTSLGFVLVGIGLLCLGLGVGWWWTRRTRSRLDAGQNDPDEYTRNSNDQRKRDRNTPNSSEQADDRLDHASEGASRDTGGFVFDTDGNDLPDEEDEGWS